MAEYKDFSYLNLKKIYLITSRTKPDNMQSKHTSSFVV